MYSLHKVIKFYYLRLSILITILPRYLSERRKNQFVVKIDECLYVECICQFLMKKLTFDYDRELNVDRQLFLDRKPGYRDRRVWFLSHQSNYII